ncbi:glycerol-3-phosphate dehydrogenase, partial [Nocardia farcinica]
PTDFLIRRTGMLYFDIEDVLKYKDAVVDVLAQLLNYDDIQRALFTEELDEAINEARTANDQPAE